MIFGLTAIMVIVLLKNAIAAQMASWKHREAVAGMLRAQADCMDYQIAAGRLVFDSRTDNRFHPAAYDKLVKQAKATTDHAQRVALYQQAQQLLAQQLPISPIAHSTVYQPMRKSVQGFLISPFGRNTFYGVSNQP